ncbi:HlyD family type I secretion periplasmic adaptor subunit [Aestuariispira insulae]|uniref:Membrane fusion protein (MFP) family protein n=1 Tax=Aestuariispira insulae TaxID=1461337 RepID=A0A3D9H1H7_9PROT|nr:HlyD family type I secretion periplasmic adaptor subunit [Aestuariispira insulae]RED43348.1 HlyD family secretion protein [Aestuariispira insulae]
MDNKDSTISTLANGRVMKPFIIGLLFILIFFGGLTAWSVLAPLSGAVIASGNIAPEGTTRVLQHLEGGIVEEILVKEGDQVIAGQPMIKLEQVQAQARFERLKSRDNAMAVRKSRLIAELHDIDSWAPDACCRGKNHLVGTSEKMLFDVRREKYQKELALYRARQTQLEQDIAGLQLQGQELTEQIDLIEREIQNVQILLNKGLEKLPRMLALQRAKHQLKERIVSNGARIASLRQEIETTDLRQLLAKSSRLEEINQELLEIRRSRLELAEEISSAQDVLERTIIRAPVSGVSENIRVKTRGGVIAPGAEILDIVPGNEKMIVEAKVRPTDIDDVRKGQKAQVHLSAYSYRSTAPLEGIVETVSADLMEASAPVGPQQMPYYAARVLIDPVSLANLPAEIELTAGMPAEVFLTTPSRTVFDYLVGPMREAIRRAIREP